MLQFGSCPRCQSQMSEDRLAFKPMICGNCGFSSRESEIKALDFIEKRFIKTAMTLTTVFVISFVQAVSWDKYAVEIIPLKIKQTLGMTSADDVRRIAEICVDRKKHQCVEEAFQSLTTTSNEAFAELGKYQMRQNKFREAAVNFKAYFDRGGLDLESSYQFGKALGKMGQVELASNYFDQVLKAKPETLQVTVTQNYVKMLIENGRSAQAVGLIESIRDSSPSANMFMQAELNQLKQTIK